MSIPTQPPIRVAAPPVQARPSAQSAGLRYATVVIAAADSLHPEDADVVCPGVDDDQTISKVVDSLAKGSVELMEGSFHFSNDVFAFSPAELDVRGQGHATQVIGGGFILQAQSRISNLLIRDIRADGETGVYLSAEGSACEGVWFSGVFPNGAIYMANANSKACGNTLVGVTGCTDAAIYAAHANQTVDHNLIVASRAPDTGYLIYLGADTQTCTGNILKGSAAGYGIYSGGDHQTVVANTAPGGGPAWDPLADNYDSLNTFLQAAIACYGNHSGIGFNALNGVAIPNFGLSNQIGFNS